ncbi:hypothetical protein FA10DRAFT_284759 [Acaromyces ingoldii]|uniref:Uncharacterized protein n=1 Tax=Acaromyces ingoldii TaxID=215250 RepID=A0A316YT40_9BASI|nr:hypothetical protein FA10DRAFT_284759 [Acaromyces ingoldii]PWN91838.1 hypothetical protein FA10DRAFT_284759 [Acaromyces ingoldii]
MPPKRELSSDAVLLPDETDRKSDDVKQSSTPQKKKFKKGPTTPGGGQPWKEEEDQMIYAAAFDKLPSLSSDKVAMLASKTGRTEKAVRLRYNKLRAMLLGKLS